MTVAAEDARQRLDHLLAKLGTWGARAQVQRLIVGGLVRLDGRVAKSSAVVRDGQHIEVRPAPPTATSGVQPAAIPLEVLFEDEWLLVINKPAGLVVHPAPGNWQGTLVSALLHRWQGTPTDLDPLRPGIVHRLDKETSGVLLIAKDATTLAEMSRQFRAREVTKEYLALVWGRPKEPRGEISQPIGRHPVHRKRMSVRPRGRAAVTRYEVVAHAAGVSLMRAWPKTGRTHQIRVHLAAIGCPVVGDTTYGGGGGRAVALGMTRQALHAATLTVRHPRTATPLSVTAPMPADLRQVCERLAIPVLTSKDPSSSVHQRNAPSPGKSATLVPFGQTRSSRHASPS